VQGDGKLLPGGTFASVNGTALNCWEFAFHRAAPETGRASK